MRLVCCLVFSPTLALGPWKNSCLWLLGDNAHPRGQWEAIPAPCAGPAEGTGPSAGPQVYGRGENGQRRCVFHISLI